MDAKIYIPLLKNKLQHLLDDHEATTNNLRLKRQVQKSIDNLHAAKQLLKDVDDFAEALGSVKDQRNTVQLLRAVYAVEDATDTFILTKEYQRRKKEELEDQKRWSRSSLIKKICSCSCYYGSKSFYSLILFYKKMKNFNDEIRRLVEIKGAGTSSNIEINNNTRLLSFQSDRDGLSQRQHWERIFDFCLEEETDVVGDLQHQINDLVLRLIPQLNQHHCNDLSAQVIAVVGEGGSGKTALARTVYNRIEVKRHFSKRAWVCIPSVFNARDLLIDILEQVNPAELLVDATLNEAALMCKLTRHLFGSKFLIVLDDVNTPHIWESLLFDFLHSQGGKVIITSRSTDNLPPDVVYSTLNIRRLNDEESWKLFSNEVRMENELNNPKLFEIKEKILNICAGLPSVILLLAGLLSTRDQSSDEWSRVLIRLADKSSQDIIALSFHDLPFEIKPCFLYMGLFPRGFQIPIRRLVNLWCAEEFMTPLVSREINPENLAEMCLEELVTRNMVEVSWRVDGTPKTCCMPNILYDFFSLKASHVGFLDHQLCSFHTSQKQQKLGVRRLAAYMHIDYSSPLPHVGHLRSCLAFDTRRIPITPVSHVDMLLNKIVSSKELGLLRVLDLEGVFKPRLSDNLFKNLFMLSYLGLRSTFVDDIPNIQLLANNLESLDVKNTNISLLDLTLFQKLQHIHVNRNIHRTILPAMDSNTLRTLWGVCFNQHNLDPLGSFFRMEKLIKLGLKLCAEVQTLKNIAEHINQLTELQSLKLGSINRDGQASTIELQTLVKHQKLENLYLLGNLPQSVIDVGFLPPNLRKLTLSFSRLEEDPMPVLGQLPHLNILRLFSSSYKGGLMTCSFKGFPKLRQLKLWKLLVRLWTVEEGAMPCLRELEIRSCHHLELPQGLQNVTTLKDLILTNMSMDFVAAVEESLKNREVHIRNNTWNSIPFPISK